MTKREENEMSTAVLADLIGTIETSKIADRNSAAQALSVVRDLVITGEGPTTKGRIHFSRALDADDAAWCARILTASAVAQQPVSRAEAEALFEIDHAAAGAQRRWPLRRSFRKGRRASRRRGLWSRCSVTDRRAVA